MRQIELIRLGLNFYPISNVLPTEMIMSKSMNRRILALLLTPLLSSCETAHDVGVTTFRVIDAPAAYVRRQIDEEGQVTQTTTTTTETQVYPPGTATNQPPPTYAVQQPPPPPVQTQTQRRIISDEPSPPAQGEANPTAPSRVARSENTSRSPSTNSPTTRTTSSQSASADIPYGKPVPGKPGYVFSPFDKNGGYVDVTGYAPGQKVKDPYTGKIFLVP